MHPCESESANIASVVSSAPLPVRAFDVAACAAAPRSAAPPFASNWGLLWAQQTSAQSLGAKLQSGLVSWFGWDRGYLLSGRATVFEADW